MEKKPKKNKTASCSDGIEHEENHDRESPARDISLDMDVPDHFDNDINAESDANCDEESNDNEQCRISRLLNFQKEHPLADSHGIRRIKDNPTRIPNFAGANLPRCDEGDREFYCSTMLTLFKPWRKGGDLKGVNMSWDEAFHAHPFSERETRYMRNFNVRYECLDARDDYRAQMKNSLADPTITGSWNLNEVEDDADENLHGVYPENVELDDTPMGPLLLGPKHKKRMMETELVRQMMCGMGWADPLNTMQPRPESFIREKKIPSAAWEREIDMLKKTILNQKNVYNVPHDPGKDISPHTLHPHRTPNDVKIVDKSYLDRKFYVDGASDLIDSTVEKFTLNKEQERAFCIITNHAVSKNPEQLRMNLGGMGGTGKTRVIKALSNFFTSRNEAHRFIIVAPTGTAAALLGGSTYH
jgi:PIF1-like helicase